ISIREEDIMVQFHGDYEAEAYLLKRLVDGGIPVSGFIREQGDLESIFMQITNREKGKVVLTSEE
ncbi:MAG: ABC transporter ATP-binding protein, partial [Lachnospiraceae bacterium]|nr:ABC transporter ATP-binding protein [Lachnospiraceae bacterium]